jgi:predicted O-methyltransferase YrrM
LQAVSGTGAKRRNSFAPLRGELIQIASIMNLSSGIPAVDRYLDDGFLSVRGMSSRFAASITAATMRLQAEHGISGHAAEIGTFEGRFFIALAHSLRADERAIGIDRFSWPDSGLRARFDRNCAAYGPEAERMIVVEADSRGLAPETLLKLAPGQRIRFFHVDGDHDVGGMGKDLALARDTIDPAGVICLDDMLHPGYPLLAVTVAGFLDANPELRVFCVVDREDIVAATKFMICRAEHATFYIDALMRSFPDHVWWMVADFVTYEALVLAPDPKVADIG